MRNWFGGTATDWTLEIPDIQTREILVKGGVPLTFWSAATGGFQYTDLLLNATEVNTVYTGNGSSVPLGQCPEFQGPDGIREMYCQAESSPYRFKMTCTNIGELLTIHETGVDPHGDRAYADTLLAGVQAGSTTALGTVTLESFAGADYNAKFTAALSYAAAQTVKPTIVFPNKSITLSAGPWEYFNGLRISGPVAAPDREFTSSAQCVVNLSAPMFKMPISGEDVRDISIRGILFKATSSSVDWMARVTDLAAGPEMQDATFSDLAWTGFASVMHARHLRCSIQRMYCNNGTDVQFKIGGSDNYYWTEGYSFLSGNVPANSYYIYFSHMSRTTVGELYITPQYGTAVRIDGTYGNLVFRGTRFDCTGRTLSNACQGSAVFINTGEGYVFQDCWFFNNAVAPSATGRSDKGQVYVKNPAKNILFSGCQWNGGAKQTLVTPAGTPAIYCQSGVTGVRVSNPMAPHNGEKLLQQAAAGAVTCDDPSWTITTAV